MKIEWNKVTRFSQIVALVLFVGVFLFGIWLGMRIEAQKTVEASGTRMHSRTSQIQQTDSIVATYSCDGGKNIQATYKEKSVLLLFTDRKSMTLAQTISADGIRYANADGSFVFWSKGTGAFATQGSSTPYAHCLQIAAPVS